MVFMLKMRKSQQLCLIRLLMHLVHYLVCKEFYSIEKEFLLLGVVEFYRIDNPVSFSDEDEEVSSRCRIQITSVSECSFFFSFVCDMEV